MSLLDDMLKGKKPEEKIPPANKPVSPFAGLKQTLSNVKNQDTKDSAMKFLGKTLAKKPKLLIIDDLEQDTKPTIEKDMPATLQNVSNYVFEEQPEQSTLEITEKMDEMLQSLSQSLGEEVPTNLAKCLRFIKEHAFLAEILRPESISILVQSLRKSRGYIVQKKTASSAKKAKRQEKLEAVTADLANLDLF